MAKKSILFFLLLCCLLLSLKIETGFCEEGQVVWDQRTPLSRADKDFFTRLYFEEHFNKEHKGYVNEFLDDTIFHQTFVYDHAATDYASTDFYATDFSGTDLLMSMLPAEQTYKTTNSYLNFLQYKKEEFHVTLFVRETENLPGKKGGRCWIRYSDVFSVGKGNESGVIFYPGDKAYRLDTTDGKAAYTEIADLSSFSPRKWTQLDFIRANGIIYFYANGTYLFDYQDNIQGAVSFDMGAELRENGTRIRCDFDDFVIRIH